EHAATAAIAMATSAQLSPLRGMPVVSHPFGGYISVCRSMSQLTPFNTVGPFFKLLVRDRPEGTDCLVSEATRGERITITGKLIAGHGSGVDDGLVEIWQADAAGHYHHPVDPDSAAADPAFSGFGRAAT